MLSDISKSFDSYRRTFNCEMTQGSRHFRTFCQPEPRGTDLIKRNPSKNTREKGSSCLLYNIKS